MFGQCTFSCFRKCMKYFWDSVVPFLGQCTYYFWEIVRAVFETVYVLFLEQCKFCFWNSVSSVFGTVYVLFLEQCKFCFWDSVHSIFGTELQRVSCFWVNTGVALSVHISIDKSYPEIAPRIFFLKCRQTSG